jgi:hypothetical protein
MSSISLGRTKRAQFPHPRPDAIVEGIEGTLFPRSPKLVRALYDQAHALNSGGFIMGSGPVSRRLSRHKVGHLSKLAIALGVTRVLQCAP